MSSLFAEYPISAVARMPSPWLKFYDADVPTHLDYPRIPLYSLLDDTATRYPNKTCAVFYLKFYGKRLVYRQIQEATNGFAASLRELGVRKGARVALLLPNSPQFIIAYYGALKAGAVVVPLNPLYTEHELTFHLTDSETEAIVTLPMFLDKVTSLRRNTPLKRIIVSRLADYMPPPMNMVQGLEEQNLINAHRDAGLIPFQRLLKPAPNFVPEPVEPDEMAVLIYSGGTTGVAKAIMLSHFNCVVNAYQDVTWAHVDEKSRLLAILPMFHGLGMSVTMNTPILRGAEIILMPRFNAHDAIKVIQRFKPTFLVGVPTMFAAFSALPDIERYNLGSLKGIFVGAAPLSRATKDSFEARTGGRMIEGYGLTEVVTAVMANPYYGQHKVGSIGLPFPDVDAKIVGIEDGHDLPPGEVGEIALRTPAMMLGYYKNPEETRKTIVDGWLHTGDLGYMDEDGYFYVTDRKKDLIIVGGFNVFPREIDELVCAHPKVKEGIAIGIPDAYKGERIKVFIVLREGATATPEEFITYFREHLVPYKVPNDVEFRTDLPKSMIGKIMRRALREEEVRKQH